MFRGEYQHSIDAKGRVVLPSKFRDKLGKLFIITKGLDKCLFVYPLETWERFEAKVPHMSMGDESERWFLRTFIGGATEGEPDAQGRVNLPPSLREYAGIKKDVISLGVVNRIEIWGKERWDIYNNESNFQDKELAEKISQLGI